MGVRLSNKLNVSDVANPLDALKAGQVGDTDTKTVVWLGNIIGLASGLSYRSNNFGDGPSIALTGVFEAIPHDPALDTVQSPSLFMPQAVQAMLVAAMIGEGEHAVTATPKKGQKIDVPGRQMKVMFEVGCRRNAAVGGAGYEFVVNQVGEVQKVEVLEALRAELADGKARALPAPAKQAALTASATARDVTQFAKRPAKKVAGKKK